MGPVPDLSRWLCDWCLKHLLKTEKYQKNAANKPKIIISFFLNPTFHLCTFHLCLCCFPFQLFTFHGSFRTWYPLSSISSTAFDKGVTSWSSKDSSTARPGGEFLSAMPEKEKDISSLSKQHFWGFKIQIFFIFEGYGRLALKNKVGFHT